MEGKLHQARYCSIRVVSPDELVPNSSDTGTVSKRPTHQIPMTPAPQVAVTSTAQSKHCDSDDDIERDGVQKPVGIKPLSRSYLYMTADGKLNVAESGNIPIPQLTFELIPKGGLVSPVPISFQSKCYLDRYITGHPNIAVGDMIDGRKENDESLSIWFIENFGDKQKLYMKYSLPGAIKKLYFFIDNNGTLLLREKEDLQKNEGIFELISLQSA